MSGSSTVKLHVAQSASPYIASGSFQGNGEWHFAIDGSVEIGVFDCEIEVNDGTYVFTIGKGTFSEEPEIV